MKKKLESELVSIAHRILKLKGKEDVVRMHEEVSQLYEKLTVLRFAQENFEEAMPTIGHDSSFFDMLDSAFNNKVSDNIEVENKVYVNMDTSDREELVEPLMEKIKNMVDLMPESAGQIEAAVNQISEEESLKKAFEDLAANFEKMPEFEPVSEIDNHVTSDQKKSLNDRLKGKQLQIGLNDKLAFIKHLFDGNSDDYNRVISQLNTSKSAEEAKELILGMVKPDYNNWTGKEEVENRFLELIENRFN